jgi:hypothetical protein
MSAIARHRAGVISVRRPVLALVALVSVLLCAAPAAASVKATARQQRALASAIRTSPVAGLDKVPTVRYRVTGQRISSTSKSWAIARLVAQPAFRSRFQSGYVIAVQPAGTQRWVVVDAGSSEVGCGIAPNSVIADLIGARNAAEACPPGEGIA